MAATSKGPFSTRALIKEREKVKAEIAAAKLLPERLKVLNKLIALYGADDESVSGNGNGHVEYAYECPRKNCDRTFDTQQGLSRHIGWHKGQRR